MNDIFDLIDALRDARGLSGRKLADRAGLKPTTFASIMSRRPPEIPKAYLEAIAAALGVRWYDLLNVSPDAYPDNGNKVKVPTALSDYDKEQAFFKVLGPKADPYAVYAEQADAAGAAVNEGFITFANHDQIHYEQYKKAICILLDTLNANGLFETMNYVMRLSSDSRFSANSDAHHSNKEDTE